MPLWEEVILRLWLCDFSKTASTEGLFMSVAVEDIFPECEWFGVGRLENDKPNT
jgi:hypothetical protein